MLQNELQFNIYFLFLQNNNSEKTFYEKSLIKIMKTKRFRTQKHFVSGSNISTNSDRLQRL